MHPEIPVLGVLCYYPGCHIWSRSAGMFPNNLGYPVGVVVNCFFEDSQDASGHVNHQVWA